MLETAWLYIRSPAAAARRMRKAELDRDSLWLYAASTLAFTLVYRWKPFDFPDAAAPVPYEMQDLGYWLKADLWQPVLEAGWVVFMVGLLRLFASGSWPIRLACAVFLTASPFILIAAYGQLHAFPYWAFAAGCAAWVLPFYFLTARAGKAHWWPYINFSLGINAIGLPIAGLLAISVILRQADAFKAVQITGGLWLLGGATMGARELSSLRMPRAFMAVILSIFLQLALAFCLHFLGAKGVLKALFYG